MEELVRFSVTMEAELLGRFDALVARRGTRANRSEAVRDLVREALVEHRVENPDAEIAGTITMVFDHHESELSDRLNAIQHQYIHEIVSTVHVHLDSRNCLEVIVLRGGSARIRAIADTLLGTKGVKHGKLVTTTTGDVRAPGVDHRHWHSHVHRHDPDHPDHHAHDHDFDHPHPHEPDHAHHHLHGYRHAQAHDHEHDHSEGHEHDHPHETVHDFSPAGPGLDHSPG